MYEYIKRAMQGWTYILLFVLIGVVIGSSVVLAFQKDNVLKITRFVNDEPTASEIITPDDLASTPECNGVRYEVDYHRPK